MPWEDFCYLKACTLVVVGTATGRVALGIAPASNLSEKSFFPKKTFEPKLAFGNLEVH
jgi:hypothetical protein